MSTGQGISITEITTYFDGWEWCVTDTVINQQGQDERVKTAYRTNEHGEGMWKWEAVESWSPAFHYEYKQVLGTTQFDLRFCTKSAVYQRIRRYFSKSAEETA